ncbi:MAG TPA: hypothetical protein ENN80_11270, partial [Candidatus Hydrogenedentes bacterium]|nr:hypothetical protein [Candidatus Hydrogenedentota bacterium]
MRLTLIIACVLTWMLGAYAELAPEQRASLGEAYAVLAQREDIAAADYVIAVLGDPGVTDEDWTTFLIDYAAEGAFTPPLASFWNYAAEIGGPKGGRAIFLAGQCAVAVLGMQLRRQDAVLPYELWALPVNWLVENRGRLNPERRAQVIGILQRVAPGHPPFLEPLLRAEPTEIPWLTTRFCLTVKDYLPEGSEARARLPRLIPMPSHMQQCWESHGMILVERTLLDEGQYSSLAALMRSIPSSLHSIEAVIVSQAQEPRPEPPVNLEPAAWVLVEPISMSITSSQKEFSARVG